MRRYSSGSVIGAEPLYADPADEFVRVSPPFTRVDMADLDALVFLGATAAPDPRSLVSTRFGEFYEPAERWNRPGGTAVEDLIQKKERIITAHVATLAKINRGILDGMSSVLVDKDWEARAGVGLKNLFDSFLQLDKQTSLGMTSADKLELAKLWFQNAENMRMTIAGAGHESLMNDIDDLIAQYRAELERTDKEILAAEDEHKRANLEGKRRKIVWKT